MPVFYSILAIAIGIGVAIVATIAVLVDAIQHNVSRRGVHCSVEIVAVRRRFRCAALARVRAVHVGRSNRRTSHFTVAVVIAIDVAALSTVAVLVHTVGGDLEITGNGELWSLAGLRADLSVAGAVTISV